MTTHRHQDSRAKWTTSVTDPDLSGLATRADLAALEMRVAALERPISPTVVALAQPAVVAVRADPIYVAAMQAPATAAFSDSFNQGAFQCL